MSKKAPIPPCPCGSASYVLCCGRFHHGAVPETAAQLMRSRYSAYAMGLMEYVHDTWHSSTRGSLPALQHEASPVAAKWLGLEIRTQEQTGDAATVEFVARYRLEGRAHRLHEISRFAREEGKWFYVDGSFPER